MVGRGSESGNVALRVRCEGSCLTMKAWSRSIGLLGDEEKYLYPVRDSYGSVIVHFTKVSWFHVPYT